MKHTVLWTQVELKYRKEELEKLEHFGNLRKILLLPRPFAIQEKWATKIKTRNKMESLPLLRASPGPQDACHTNRDLSQEREAWDAALAKTIAKAIAREMEKAQVHYQALLNERSTAVIPTSLKVTSRANGFKVMDPFDWTKDKLSTRDGNCG